MIKDYDCGIKYYPGKANVIADALSQKNEEFFSTVKSYKLMINSDFFGEITKVQSEVLMVEGLIKKERICGQQNELIDNTHGVKAMFDRIWIPHLGNLRGRIFDEAHKSRYSIHPRSTKIYQDLKRGYRCRA
ncbi:uncharacterized protein LOC143553396 [Bidens hawaiensis]|uniref:uncharacterized protein LOC143553396 n=1 Tax=Bidens hawaiensis TaxID=980011 RepID=UPI00404A9E97